jgi:1-aminocyclopropane-1-carboxylate deaminase/D-cysteine desulfhydrase-like pyridoxal-dependent ACC family enzyme
MLWAEEGILLEPIYNGKAFAGMLDLIQSGEISGRILFWHTGGAPAFFALNPEQILPRAVPSEF